MPLQVTDLVWPPRWRKGNETQVNSPLVAVDALTGKNDWTQRPPIVRDKKAPVMGGVGWSKSHRREGLFLDQRDSEMTGDKRTGVVAGASMRKPKFKTHGHQTAESKQAQTIPSAQSAFSQDNKQARFPEE